MAEIQSELFDGKPSRKKRESRLERTLRQYDEAERPQRLERLRYLEDVYPKDLSFFGDFETHFVFDELRAAFVNGELVATILLAQAFIERRFQLYFEQMDMESIGRRGLAAMIKYLIRQAYGPEFLLKRIDELRKIRNPFVHLKERNHEHALDARLFNALKNNSDASIYELMLGDAKEAISLAFAVAERMRPDLGLARK